MPEMDLRSRLHPDSIPDLLAIHQTFCLSSYCKLVTWLLLVVLGPLEASVPLLSSFVFQDSDQLITLRLCPNSLVESFNCIHCWHFLDCGMGLI